MSEPGSEPGPEPGQAATPSPSASELESSGQAAGSKSSQEPATGVSSCKAGHWIEIQLVGEDDSAIADEKCILIAPDGKEHKCKTDASGVVRLEGIPDGATKLSFTHLDGAAWEPAK